MYLHSEGMISSFGILEKLLLGRVTRLMQEKAQYLALQTNLMWK